MTCEIQPVADGNELLCGPQNINLTDQYLLSVSISGNHLSLQCLWLVTSPPETVIFVDVLNIDLTYYRQHFVFGRGHNSANESTVLQKIDHSNAWTFHGSSLFFTETYLWIMFTSTVYNDENNPPTQNLLLRAENYTGEIHCNSGQVLCKEDSKCIPRRAVCDGTVHCTNYMDEAIDCDRCGTSEIDLRFGEPITIRGEFEVDRTSDIGHITGHFAIYPGDSEVLPNTTDVLLTNYTEGVPRLECVWRLTEPEGTRIRVTVAEFADSRSVMRIGNGPDPTALPVLVIRSAYGIRLPFDVLSIDSGMWITWERESYYWDDIKLRMVFTTYNITECPESQFSCPSGLDCLDNISHVCDGHRECAAYGDELGCGECGQQEFRCSTMDVCLPRYHICDGNVDCGDHSDELMCGFCGNETVYLTPNETYTVHAEEQIITCLWLFIAKSGWRIEAQIQRLDPICNVDVGVGYDSTRPVRHEVVREVRTNRHFSYPRSIPTNYSIMWIKAECGFSHFRLAKDKLQIDVRQYKNVECSSSEQMCMSGLGCIQEEERCDGTAACPGYWDEIGCGNCSTSEFACRSANKCVPIGYICDGKNDCPDLSDELECEPCGGSFYDLSSREFETLTSPGWPESDYPPLLQCLWILVAEVGYRIVLSFEEFLLEESYDFLYCGDGDDFKSAFLTVTGDRFPLLVASTSNEMFLRFTSDGSIQKSGFELQVEQKPAETVSCRDGEIPCKAENLICVRNDSSEQGLQFCSKDECGYRVIYIYGTSVDLRSPGYPDHYPSDIACRWEVSSKDVLVSIVEFATEASRDVLVFEGSTLHGGKVVSFEVDGDTKIRTLAFNSSVQIIFTTDSTVTKSGFVLRLYKYFSANESTSCPKPTYFDCGDGSCVSPDARCDGFKDCQTHGSDELDCQDITCPEFYHCLDSPECIHWPLVCDGSPDCPNEDDETDSQCAQRCPNGCRCKVDDDSVQVACTHGWNELTLANLAKRTEHLELSEGNATYLAKGLFKEFKYLKSLLLKDNNIYALTPGTFYGLTNLTFLDISNNSIRRINGNSFSELQSLEVMIAADIPLETIEENAFDGLKMLEVMVLIRGSSSNQSTVDIKDDALTDLVRLNKLFVDDYRLCCEFVSSVDFDVANCFTTELQPPLNLCGSLMRNNLLRVAMWILGLSALIGNAVVIVWRCYQGKEIGGKKTHSFFVLNLAVSDLMMGVYMLMIAVADVHFGEKYSRVAHEWRSSPICKIAGVISVLSSEASVFFVTLISLDSFFSIVFPFSRIRIREKSATVTVCVLWLASVGLSIGPTVFVESDSKVYGLSDVCIGLPLLTKPTSYDFEESDIDNPVGTDTIKVPVGKGKQPAWIYSIILFLGVNLLCFLVVLCCYVAIFVKVKRTVSRVRRTTHRDQEIKLAVKMALIVGTDFACWMPVIIMGILSQTGAVDISPDMYAWIVVFILPINSSLNPYMYTFYTTIATRRHNQRALSEKTRFATEMKTKSLDTINSTISDNKSS
ncbi:uncharacterized protein LOC110983163 [Acanthaster planci]|uniref:Uncharacterized protein LOC110983163 n=1 Tax=Acanthaster planci TaxID=133434 RepID=A0A8B7YX08_ACAPL|nr:uncharacterized protein LOC110983163 [Acanthaster planci]